MFAKFHSRVHVATLCDEMTALKIYYFLNLKRLFFTICFVVFEVFKLFTIHLQECLRKILFNDVNKITFKQVRQNDSTLLLRDRVYFVNVICNTLCVHLYCVVLLLLVL